MAWLIVAYSVLASMSAVSLALVFALRFRSRQPADAQPGSYASVPVLVPIRGVDQQTQDVLQSLISSNLLPIDFAWLAQDGGVWVRMAGEAGSETTGWVLLNSRGKLRGRLDLPANFRIRWRRGDLFSAVEPDEYDVPWVVRFRITSAGPSLVSRCPFRSRSSLQGARPQERRAATSEREQKSDSGRGPETREWGSHFGLPPEEFMESRGQGRTFRLEDKEKGA
jgi:hypothetical protein